MARAKPYTSKTYARDKGYRIAARNRKAAKFEKETGWNSDVVWMILIVIATIFTAILK